MARQGMKSCGFPFERDNKRVISKFLFNRRIVSGALVSLFYRNAASIQTFSGFTGRRAIKLSRARWRRSKMIAALPALA